MNLLRRSASAADGADETGQASPAPDKQQQQAARQQRAAQRSAQMGRTREARKATSALRPPEQQRALYVALVLLAIAVFSYLSKDVVPEDVTVKHKTVVKNVVQHHPEAAVLLGILVLLALGTLYFRKRVVTATAFILTAAIGVGVPLPANAGDIKWVAFIVPGGYAMWVLIIRMRKDQTEWMAQHAPAATPGARSSSGTTRARSQPKTTSTSTAGRARKVKDQPVVGPNGKTLPPNSGRYTRPRGKARAAQRRS